MATPSQRSVKPSAQPTMVRIHHLPPPAQTARDRGILPGCGPSWVVSSSVISGQVIAEFRANEGRVGGSFEGAPMILVHHVGRKTGREFVASLVYLAKEGEGQALYIFASKGGAPSHPDWCHDLVAAGKLPSRSGRTPTR
jgi:F420H(2)-dependent quinone reductase